MSGFNVLLAENRFDGVTLRRDRRCYLRISAMLLTGAVFGLALAAVLSILAVEAWGIAEWIAIALVR